MADSQYDLPPKVIRLFHEKQKIREAIRKTILMRETNPHIRYGHPLDNAIVRYHALFTYRNEHVYATPKNVGIFFLTIVLPAGLLFYDMVRHTKEKESLIRSGQIAYENRCFKQVI